MAKKLICLVTILVMLGLAASASASLVAHWKLDETSGTAASDSSKNARHATVGGTPNWVAGMVDGALDLDGETNFLDVNAEIVRGTCTVALWLKPRNLPYASGFRAIIHDDQWNSGSLHGHLRANTSLFNFDINGGGAVTSTTVAQSDEWYHLTGTFDIEKRESKLYVNGTLEATATGLNTALYVGPLNWGAWTDNQRFFDGVMDDIRVYSRVLTDSQVLDLANGIPPTFLKAEKPSPEDGATGVTLQLLSWTKGETAMFHDVYVGTTPELTEANLVAPRIFPTVLWYAPGLVPGTTYYWRVDEIDAAGTIITGDVWSFTATPLTAYLPNPTDEGEDVLLDPTLSWTAGLNAVKHHVYFGADRSAVEAAAPETDKGELSASETSYKVTDALKPDMTYYWRVDETDLSNAVHTGDVWSFSTIPAGPGGAIRQWWLGIGGTDIPSLTGSANYPDNPSGQEFLPLMEGPVNWADNYGTRLYGWVYPPETGDYTFWISGDDNCELWLSTDADPANKELIATVASWTTSREWTKEANQRSTAISLEAGRQYYIEALMKEGGGGDNLAVAWQGPGFSMEVIGAGGVGPTPFLPVRAYAPYPADGAVNTLQDLILRWSAGEKAQQHEVYFGDDANAVAVADTSSPLFMGRQSGTTFDAGALEWGKTFHWRVDEINEGDAESPWVGRVWSFSTADFIPVDDFESYTDNMDAGEAIWQTWIDGLTNGTGSIVGYFDAANGTFCETTIVHGGTQSMPLDYNNIVSPYYSEAELPLSPAQNWTAEGVDALSLWYRGFAVSFLETADGITMSAAGADIYNQTDEFRYAWKRLSGDGSITVRVDSADNVHTWTKAGVMIRETLDPVVKAVHMIVTPSGRVEFQYRDFAGANTTQPSLATGSITLPYWVRLTRTGDTFTGEYSANGTSWQQLIVGADTSTTTISMFGSVYIGLCVTSHVAGTSTVAQFSNITTTGGVSGAWQVAEVGVDHPGNSQDDLYVGIQDSTNKSAFVVNPDPAAVNVTDWTEWRIPLSSFGGVNLARVNRLYIGVGDRDNPTPDGNGLLFIDDIRVVRAEPVE